MDYCISSDLIETEEAEEHYAEHLVRLTTLPTYERRHSSVAPAERDGFGLPEQGRLYCCPQRIAKFHPDADGLFASVLQADSQGFLVLLEGRPSRAAESLRHRFRRTLGPLSSRVIFVPAQSPQDFRRLLGLADVILDPPHYSAGFTAYDAFALKRPIVSLPDNFAVGRYTQACYRKMGLEHLIPASPEEYIALAVRLATDRQYQREQRAEVARRCHVLFEDIETVREYERFFEMALHEPKATTGLDAPHLQSAIA